MHSGAYFSGPAIPQSVGRRLIAPGARSEPHIKEKEGGAAQAAHKHVGDSWARNAAVVAMKSHYRQIMSGMN